MRLLGCSIQDERVLDAAFEGIVEFLERAKGRAVARGYVILYGSNGEEVRCLLTITNVGCKKGRHRSVMQANNMAKELRLAGCTVVIRYLHLYRGSHDDRGPCGCHISPTCCQFIVDRTPNTYRLMRGAEKRQTRRLTTYSHGNRRSRRCSGFYIIQRTLAQ
jgi:hypothetical protein